LRWLWYFIKYYENDEEVDLAMRIVNFYLSEDESVHFRELGNNLRKDIHDFITKSFQCNGHKLFEASFLDIMTMGNATTGINEAEHRVYHYHSQGPMRTSSEDGREGKERLSIPSSSGGRCVLH